MKCPASAAKRDLSIGDIDVTTGVNVDGVDLDLDLDDITDIVSDLPIDLNKRQLLGLDLGLDLTPVTDLVGDLLTTVTGLLPTLTSEISDVEALVNGLVDGTVADVEATLTTITSTLNDVLAQLGGLDLGDLASLTKRQTVDVDLSSLLDQVTGILNSVVSLTGTVDVTPVVDLVQTVLDTVTGLTSVLGLKKH